MATSSVSKSISPKKSEHPNIFLTISNTSSRVHDLKSQSRCSDPVQYYEFLQNRVLITFKPKFGEPDHRDYPEFKLILSKKQNYDIVSR